MRDLIERVIPDSEEELDSDISDLHWQNFPKYNWEDFERARNLSMGSAKIDDEVMGSFGAVEHVENNPKNEAKVDRQILDLLEDDNVDEDGDRIEDEMIMDDAIDDDSSDEDINGCIDDKDNSGPLDQRQRNKPFKCLIGTCTKSFGTYLGLKKHESYHRRMNSSNAEYECRISGCNRDYFTSGGLQYHRAVTHPETIKKEPVTKCQIEDCPYVFTKSKRRPLLDHLSRVHGLWKCLWRGKCQNTYSNKELHDIHREVMSEYKF